MSLHTKSPPHIYRLAKQAWSLELDERAIKTPFRFASTAAEVASGIDLTGRRVVVTGASSGIGMETARALAGTGAEVTLAVRDLAAGERAAKDITATTTNQDAVEDDR